jgi:hypothetical protein
MIEPAIEGFEGTIHYFSLNITTDYPKAPWGDTPPSPHTHNSKGIFSSFVAFENQTHPSFPSRGWCFKYLYSEKDKTLCSGKSILENIILPYLSRKQSRVSRALAPEGDSSLLECRMNGISVRREGGRW